MKAARDAKIIKLTSRMFDEFRPELDELIAKATKENARKTGLNSFRELHEYHLTQQVSAAFLHLAADLIAVFEKYDTLSEQAEVPPDLGDSTS